MPPGAISRQNHAMSKIDPIRRGEQCVTASQLVRHFGLWQERAAREPVYILHRGRPRYALTSIDVMEALCAPLAAGVADDVALAALLDAADAVAMIFDRNGAVTLASAAARARFGVAVRVGSRPTGLAMSGGEMLEDAILRVADSGIAEAVEIVPDSFRSRRLRCDLSPFPGGCLLRATDMTTEQTLAASQALVLATNAAGAAAGAVDVRLSLRGYISAPSPDLATLTGVAAEALTSARFTSLLTVASRVEAGEAVDAVATGHGPCRIAAECLVHGAQPLPVLIGIAAVTIAGRIEALAATIVRNTA